MVFVFNINGMRSSNGFFCVQNCIFGKILKRNCYRTGFFPKIMQIRKRIVEGVGLYIDPSVQTDIAAGGSRIDLAGRRPGLSAVPSVFS